MTAQPGARDGGAMEKEHDYRRTSDPMSIAIREGLEVCTMDEKRLGTVAEVTEEHFKIDVRMARDYWLSLATVASVEGDRVVLQFDEAVLDDYRLGSPAGLAASPVLAEQMNAIPSREAELTSRAEQSAGYDADPDRPMPDARDDALPRAQ